jgi:hypothetical protein
MADLSQRFCAPAPSKFSRKRLKPALGSSNGGVKACSCEKRV